MTPAPGPVFHTILTPVQAPEEKRVDSGPRVHGHLWPKTGVKFPTCEISDFPPCAHSQSNILHIKYAEKTDD